MVMYGSILLLPYPSNICTIRLYMIFLLEMHLLTFCIFQSTGIGVGVFNDACQIKQLVHR